jgi:hypothetical protein
MNEFFIDPVAPSATVESAFNKITTALRRSTEGIIEAAQCIVQYEKSSDFLQLRKRLVEEKVMAESTVSQYITIGNCTVLALNIEKLPPSFNSLYHLAKIEKSKPGFIEAQISNGKLNRASKLEAVRSWSDAKGTEWTTISIEIDAKTPDDVKAIIKKEMTEVVEKHNAKCKTRSNKKHK